MDNTKKPTFVLCAAYDAALVLKITNLGAFKITPGECSRCRTAVILSEASGALLKNDPLIKAICPECSKQINETHGSPDYRMTFGQLREATAMMANLNAKNN